MMVSFVRIYTVVDTVVPPYAFDEATGWEKKKSAREVVGDHRLIGPFWALRIRPPNLSGIYGQCPAARITCRFGLELVKPGQCLLGAVRINIRMDRNRIHRL